MLKKMRRLKYLHLLWVIIFFWLCFIQIWQISNFDIISINEPEHGKQLHRHNADTELRNFIGSAPARDYSFYQYNVSESDRIGVYRSVPDTRDASCSARSYLVSKYNCSVSVIIVYHNEARSTLLRTILSIYKRTAIKYLHELIIIDDYSEDATLLDTLATLNLPPFRHNDISSSRGSGTANISSMPLIKMQRNSYRLGLIESRNRGANLATGHYLFFIDSHCEVNVGWLEPLLDRFATTASSLLAVSPVLDKIDAHTFAYRAGSKHLLGGFDWNLHFHWVPRKLQHSYDRHSTDAFTSPAFAGGVFMISRNWFLKLHGFNTLLEIWGGESIEFSIKHWLCGGQIEIVPCSRVGHIFRKEHSFKFPRGPAAAGDAADAGDAAQTTYLRNSKIIAESWLDNYKYFFYTSKPAASEIAVNISIKDLHSLKNNLNCRPFAWYLQHVFPSLRLPSDEFAAYGTLSADQQCLHIMQRTTDDTLNKQREQQQQRHSKPAHAQLLMSNCYKNDVTQWFFHRHNAHLHSSDGICLAVLQLPLNTNEPHHQQQHQQQQQWAEYNVMPVDTQRAFAISSSHFILVLEYCDAASAMQRWLRNGPQLIHEQSHLCLDNPLGDIVTISACRHTAPSQYFRFSMEVQQL